MALKLLVVLITCNICASYAAEIGYDHCLWVGHSPFCFGPCPGGHREITKASKDPGYTDVDGAFGRNCLTGTKKLCCNGGKRVPKDHYSFDNKIPALGGKPAVPLLDIYPFIDKSPTYDEKPSLLGGQRPQIEPAPLLPQPAVDPLYPLDKDPTATYDEKPTLGGQRPQVQPTYSPSPAVDPLYPLDLSPTLGGQQRPQVLPPYQQPADVNKFGKDPYVEPAGRPTKDDYEPAFGPQTKPNYNTNKQPYDPQPSERPLYSDVVKNPAVLGGNQGRRFRYPDIRRR